jgi:hypothetical protein
MSEIKNIGRNDPCHCGSGKKYKKCCEAKDQQNRHAELEKEWNKAAKEFSAEAEKKAKEESNLPKPPASSAPHVSEHRRQPFVAPKINMPRRSGGG